MSYYFTKNIYNNNYTGLRGSVTKSRVGESDRFFDAENSPKMAISANFMNLLWKNLIF